MSDSYNLLHIKLKEKEHPMVDNCHNNLCLINCIMLKIQRLKANTVDPDEKTHYEPSHLDLQCLQIQLLLCLALEGLLTI